MSGRPWSDEECALLREFYPHFHTEKVAQAVGRSVGQCYQKAAKLGLVKTARYLASADAGRVTRAHQHPNMIASRIKPGHIPWNKGMAFDSGGRSHETRFTKGSKPSNTLPVGSLRMSKDGYLERKIGEAGGSPSNRWKSEHSLVWQKANGPIPRGSIVVFLPGRKTAVLEEITADRLECISRAENARRNHPRSRSPELARLVQLKGAITRQVNRIAREAQEQAA